MVQTRYYSSVAQPSALTASIAPSTTNIAVSTTVGFPSTTPYTLALDFGTAAEELVEVTGVAGLNLTVTRAIDGTSAQDHTAGAVVRHTLSGRDLNDSRFHESKADEVHGLTGVGNNVVGMTTTQTLTNKTLTAPTVTNPTVTGGGTWSGSPSIQTPTISSPAINAATTGSVGATISGTPGQTADLIQVRDGAGALRMDVTKDGVMQALPSSAAAIGLNVNASVGFTGALSVGQLNGTTRYAFGVNGELTLVPTTAPADAILIQAPSGFVGDLFDGQVNSVSKFRVDSTGNIPVGPTWSSWTPVWTAATTNPVLGNGTLEGRVCRIGQMVYIEILLASGTTTTFGTGAWIFSLPHNMAMDTTLNTFFGAGRGRFTSSASKDFPLVASAGAGGTNINLLPTGGTMDAVAASGGLISNAIPGAWVANQGGFSLSGWYRAA